MKTYTFLLPNVKQTSFLMILSASSWFSKVMKPYLQQILKYDKKKIPKQPSVLTKFCPLTMMTKQVKV